MSRPRPITAEQERRLVRQYLQGVSRNKLAVLFKASRPFVGDCLKRHGVIVRDLKTACLNNRLPLNGAAFDNAETSEAAAYWVGFLMADGCVHHAPSGAAQVILVLSEPDAAHVRAFKLFLGAEHSIQAVPGGGSYNSAPSVRLSVTSEQLAAALASYGVVPNKTHRAGVKSLGFNRHFWRGAVDGDGWVGIRRRLTGRRRHPETPVINLTGCHVLLSQFAEFMRSLTDTKAMVCRDKSVWQCGTSGRHAVRVAHHLYADCQVALARKHQAALSLLDRYGFLLNTSVGYHWRR